MISAKRKKFSEIFYQANLFNLFIYLIIALILIQYKIRETKHEAFRLGFTQLFS